MDAIFEPVARFALRHERILTILGGAWFALSCAVTARFIGLPDWLIIPYVTDRNSFWLAGGWNAVWWGFLHPQIAKRRDALRDDSGLIEDEAS